ncbi:MAG: hypothetical protein IKR75_04035 [Fibrobacter sp.]|nr:hypothetical protein [Fibrobacter sp.]
MMKKEYSAPKMELVEFKIQNAILCGSGCEDDVDENNWNDEFSFNAGGVTNHKA